MEFHAVLGQRFVQQLSHLEVDGRHDLVERFDEADVQAGMLQVLRHFETDEPAADDRGAFHALLAHERADAVRVRNRPECLHAGGVDTGDRGLERGRAGGDHQRIVALRIGFAGFNALDQHGLLVPVDGEHFVLNANVHVELLSHRFRRLQQQCRARLDDVANVIG
ncbi:hypothetical protein SDC9_173129 [bioreactor metagenome]|uniref:Uncharacterized protein n=1 Tax=bioreactor metagenome TaxID=1076179 RepID=A0A645GGB2_9ZZZZ